MEQKFPMVKNNNDLKVYVEAMINVDREPADSHYAWYFYQAFLKFFNAEFKDWTAHKYGLIDDKGKILRKPKTSEEKASLNAIANLVRKLKTNLNKHASSSVSKIMGYYLKYGLRTQSEVLKEFNSDERKLLNFVFKESEAVIDPDDGDHEEVNRLSVPYFDFTNIDHKSLLQGTFGTFKIGFDDAGFDDFIEAFFDDDEIEEFEIESENTYHIIQKDKQRWLVFSFPKIATIRYNKYGEDSEIITIQFAFKSADTLYASVDGNDDDEFTDSLQEFFNKEHDLMNYAAMSQILIATFNKTSMSIEDYSTGDKYMQGKSTSKGTIFWKDSNINMAYFVDEVSDQNDEIIDESTFAGTALTGYAPAIKLKPKKRLRKEN